MFRQSGVVIGILVALSAAPLISEAAIPQTEREALIALYQATNGDGWTNKDGWLNAAGTDFNDPGTECSWHGVYCGGSGTTVIALTLTFNNLEGSLPDDLSELPNLTYIAFSMNQLSGPFPLMLAGASGLRTLLIDNNQLSGPIPAAIGGFSALEGLSIAYNDFTGPLPEELFQLTNLGYLTVVGNKLTGPISPQIGQLTNLTSLALDEGCWNSFDPGLPEELGQLSGLQTLTWRCHDGNGPIPQWIGQLTELRTLDLAFTSFTGSIPPEIWSLSNLETLYLMGCNLTGEISPQIQQLSHLSWLGLYDNALTGQIPPELAQITSLHGLALSRNNLTGTIPAELGQLSSLTSLNLSGNPLTGQVPSELGQIGSTLQFLKLSSCKLSGEIPSALLDLTGLVEDGADIRWNGLYSNDPALVAFLDSKQIGGDWQSTQTAAPTGLTVSAAGDHTLWLEWSPIAYTADPGGYQASGMQVPGGAWAFLGQTQTKSATRFPVTGLQPQTPYDLRIATVTRPHPDNRFSVLSEPGPAAMATTSDVGCQLPVLEASSLCAPATLSVTSSHTSVEWSTGETTTSILVDPAADTWYWVATLGPGGCEEAATVLVRTCFFGDGLESGDLSAWSASSP